MNKPQKNKGLILFKIIVAASLVAIGWYAYRYFKRITNEGNEKDTEDSPGDVPSQLNQNVSAQNDSIPSHCSPITLATAQTAHFDMDEFKCKDGTSVPTHFRGNLQIVMNNLEVLRKEVGNVPIHINSGYRTLTYNQRVGGVKRSQHLCAFAADIRIDGQHWTPKNIVKVIENLIARGKMKEGGVGLYANFVHYSPTGKRARWNG